MLGQGLAPGVKNRRNPDFGAESVWDRGQTPVKSGQLSGITRVVEAPLITAG